MEYIIANWELILLGAIVPVASVIARITPTEVDDKALFYVLKFFDVIGLNTKPTELKKGR